jgi:HPr kinase/phosphorylase
LKNERIILPSFKQKTLVMVSSHENYIQEIKNPLFKGAMVAFKVKDLLQEFEKSLELTVVAGEAGLSRVVRLPQAHRPGLSLAGYLKNYVNQRVLVLGSTEIAYLRDLPKAVLHDRLSAILTKQTPVVIVAGKLTPIKELVAYCKKNNLPLMRSKMRTMELLTRITYFLMELFSPAATCHATLVEAFGIGVLIQGDSSVGKSEAALSLIERGHRLIADDVVKVRLREGAYLEGSCSDLTRHFMEIRGIGIINVAHLYGMVSVRDSKRIDMIVKLEVWDDADYYDRVGTEQSVQKILGIDVPYHILPVKPGRDLALLLETIVLNHRLKEMGYNSVSEFNTKLRDAIGSKQRKRRRARESTQ